VIPTIEQLKEWRKLAEGTMMISAVGEYTPEEFTTLLDEVDRLREVNAALLGALKHIMELYQLPFDQWTQTEPGQYAREAQAAIAKAEGKE
jgi:hypothetical protein